MRILTMGMGGVKASHTYEPGPHVGLKPRKSGQACATISAMTAQAEATPPIDATALWHAIGRLEDGQRQTAYALGRLEEGQHQLSQRMDRMDQRMDRLEKRIERLLYAGVAVGGAILAAVVVGQFFG